MTLRSLQLVPIDSLRHNDLKIYVNEGYGGQKIQLFPPYNFLLDYHNGNRSRAQKNFTNWYFESYLKYFNTEKFEGGMKLGSLDVRIKKLISERIDSPIILRNKKVILNEISVLVIKKFLLYDSIKAKGFNLLKRDRIRAVAFGGLLVLKGGHHRVAISKILGFESVPIYIEASNVKH
jgi:hypothetical protein